MNVFFSPVAAMKDGPGTERLRIPSRLVHFLKGEMRKQWPAGQPDSGGEGQVLVCLSSGCKSV